MSAPKDDCPEWADELGEYADRFVELLNEPEALLQALRADLDFQIAAARADTVPKVQSWFPARDAGFQVFREHSGPVGPVAVGTEWSYQGDHSRDDTFNGMRATGKPIELRGYTIMSVGSDDPDGSAKLQSRRYVDWAGLYGQLGLTIDWRVPVAAPKGKKPRARKRAD